VSTLGERIAALGEAATAAEGRVDADITTAAAEVVRRAGERVAFSGDHTVVALAGATGSGKSSLFNAITGTQLAEATVRRPTTSRAMGVAWGSEMPHDLLDWLDIPRRHLIASGPGEFSSLVLLDLPDHDSTEASHQLAVDRLVRVVDSLIWVVDPEKYADAALHERYLAPLAPYAEVMMVVLNQSDRLSPEDLDCCVTDLRRLLDAEGLRATPLMTASALRGVGVPELRELLARTAATKRASVRRIAADVAVVGRRLSDALGPRRTPRLNQRATDTLVDSLGEAAGVPVVVDAARKAWVKRGTAATTWPLVGWLGRLRADPLKRLGLERGEAARTSLPRPGAVARARLDRSLRVVAEAATAGRPLPDAHAARFPGCRGRGHRPTGRGRLVVVDGVPGAAVAAAARTGGRAGVAVRQSAARAGRPAAGARCALGLGPGPVLAARRWPARRRAAGRARARVRRSGREREGPLRRPVAAVGGRRGRRDRGAGARPRRAGALPDRRRRGSHRAAVNPD
jgi:GTP-binding protein EngB required for normal cell division